jgi:hypothetical protein
MLTRALSSRVAKCFRLAMASAVGICLAPLQLSAKQKTFPADSAEYSCQIGAKLGGAECQRLFPGFFEVDDLQVCLLNVAADFRACCAKTPDPQGCRNQAPARLDSGPSGRSLVPKKDSLSPARRTP